MWRTDLTNEEKSVLLSFKDHSPIVYPVDCGLTKQEVADALTALKKKDIIKNTKAPLYLTKKGHRFLKSVVSEQQHD